MALSWTLLGEASTLVSTAGRQSNPANSYQNRNRAGVDALALDPQDDSKVYIALGEYTNR